MWMIQEVDGTSHGFLSTISRTAQELALTTALQLFTLVVSVGRRVVMPVSKLMQCD